MDTSLSPASSSGPRSISYFWDESQPVRYKKNIPVVSSNPAACT